MKLKRLILITGVILVALPSVLLLLMRYFVVPREGYPTWEAARNMLIQDGEIVITLPNEVKLLAARCDDPRGDVSIDGQVVNTQIGYSSCTIIVDVEIRGEQETLRFRSQKLNDWNRIRFEPVNPCDPYSNYIEFENGVENSHRVIKRE